jgi:uncharacterized protein YehS (DUF1456 family)
MELTHEQRLEFLKSYNDLRNIIQTIWECQDLWMSDVRKLEDLQSQMHSVLKFVPQEDDEGNRQHYADWVLAETDED